MSGMKYMGNAAIILNREIWLAKIFQPWVHGVYIAIPVVWLADSKRWVDESDKVQSMANLEENEISFQQEEVQPNEPPSDLSSFQFVPEKIVDFSILQV